MNSEIESYTEFNENHVVTLIQYKCNGCGNFEEIEAINGDYKLRNFHVYGVITDESYPVRYICKKCHIELRQVMTSATPLNR